MKISFDFFRTAPPRIGFSFYQSICYGWMTDQRMRNLPARTCVLGCHECVDCFYHYAECPVIWSAMSKLGLIRGGYINSRLRFLLLLEGDEHIFLRLAFLHACMISIHKLRGPHSGTPLVCRERYLRGCFRDTVSSSKALKDAFSRLWRPTGMEDAI